MKIVFDDFIVTNGAGDVKRKPIIDDVAAWTGKIARKQWEAGAARKPTRHGFWGSCSGKVGKII